MVQVDELVGARFTGHAFFDVGLATMLAFVEKSDPGELTWADLDVVASYIEEHYHEPPLKGYLTMAFTSNAWFIQDAYNPDKPNLTPEEKAQRLQTRTMWSSRHVRAWQEQTTSTERCVFTGLPAVTVALSGKLADGRAGRAQMPLLQGDENINFFTEGQPGLPISGLALLALQFFPLGCAKAGLGLVAVHSENDRLTLRFARRFWAQTVHGMTEARSTGDTKMPGAGKSLKTLLIETLMEIGEEQEREHARERSASLSAYEFNNGKTADLRLHHLPLESVDFLRTVNTSTYKAAWSEVVRRAWQIPKKEKGGNSNADDAQRSASKNTLYEDIFNLPDDAPRFLRRYFLRIPRPTPSTLTGATHVTDMAAQESRTRELQLVPWSLVKLFLGKVMRMEPDRIEQIRAFGDRLAAYTRKRNSKKFFRAFYIVRYPDRLRDILLNANKDAIKSGDESLFDMDSYIDVFEDGVENYRSDWRLARDLVLMRMMDSLKDWLAQNLDAFPVQEPGTDDAGDENETATATNV